jgi:hypothetical protein
MHTTYEYTSLYAHKYYYKKDQERDEKVLNDRGLEGWEVYYIMPEAEGNWYFMRRRSDRYCEHCAQGLKDMHMLERTTGA